MNFIIDKNEYFIIIKDQHLRMVKRLSMHFCLESESKNTGRKTDKKERRKKVIQQLSLEVEMSYTQ